MSAGYFCGDEAVAFLVLFRFLRDRRLPDADVGRPVCLLFREGGIPIGGVPLVLK